MEWDYDQQAYVTSIEELETKLNELEQEGYQDGFPFAIQMILDDGSGDGIYIIVGSEYSILTFGHHKTGHTSCSWKSARQGHSRALFF